MSEKLYTTFEQFYPYYLQEHRKTGTRITHFIGTSAFLLLAVYAIFTFKLWFLLFGVFAAYGMAWIGHFFIEKNDY